jgi:hypothetical protein
LSFDAHGFIFIVRDDSSSDLQRSAMQLAAKFDWHWLRVRKYRMHAAIRRCGDASDHRVADVAMIRLDLEGPLRTSW